MTGKKRQNCGIPTYKCSVGGKQRLKYEMMISLIYSNMHAGGGSVSKSSLTCILENYSSISFFSG